VVALWGGVGALAAATGPTLGAALITVGGWRWAFFINLPIGALAWLLGRRVLSTSARRSSANPDYLGALLIAIALGSLVLGMSQGPAWGWASSRILACFAVALLIGSVFLVRSARHPEPVLDLTLFTSRSFSLANWRRFSTRWRSSRCCWATSSSSPVSGSTRSCLAGLAVTPGPLVVATVSGPAGRIAARTGFRTVLVAGFIVFVVGLSWLATRVGVSHDYLTVWLPGC